MANCSGCFNFGECLQHEGTKYYGLDAACNNVEELCENFKNKADFVEVCRCKDCKFVKLMSDGTTYACLKQQAYKKPADFCRDGKRKDE